SDWSSDVCSSDLGGDGSDGVLFFGGTTVDLAAGTASGGDGNDILVDVENLLSNFSTNDTFSGNDSNNTFLGGGGDDLLSGRNGDDRLEGGHGNDTLYGGDGHDGADLRGLLQRRPQRTHSGNSRAPGSL